MKFNKIKSIIWLQPWLLLVFVVGLWWVFSRIIGEERLSYGSIDSSVNIPNNYQYAFTDSTQVIEMGVQPLWMPVAIIIQVMKHDQVLKEMLALRNQEIRYYPFYNGTDIFTRMGGGMLEGGVAGDMPVLLGINKYQIDVVSPIQEGFTSLVSSRFKLVSELKHKRIGYTYGTNAHYALLSNLNSYGLQPDDVELVPMNIYHMIDALHDNNIDAYSAWEPFPGIAVHKYSDQVSITRTYSIGFMFFTQEFLRLNRESVMLIVAAEIRAFNWLQASRGNLLKGVEWALDESQKFYPNGKMQLTNYQISTIARKDILTNSDLPSLNDNLLDTTGFIANEFRFLQQYHFIADSVKWQEFSSHFMQDMVPEIQKNPSRFRLHDFNYNLNTISPTK
ncbi:MAG: ABC transporter substrate-binding protein [Bacteroidales bacterium]|nr:ABC transporter substrate-binding protein [Bacteroidales bacterium]